MADRLASLALFGATRAAIAAIMLIFVVTACALVWTGFIPAHYNTVTGAATYGDIGDLPTIAAAMGGMLDIGMHAARQLTYGLVVVSCLLITAFFWQLFQIVGSARHGAPFTRANAARLRRMGWLIVAPAIFDPDLFMHLVRFAPPDSSQTLLFVLFATAGLSLLVLAGVFRKGVEMREDLEGTV